MHSRTLLHAIVETTAHAFPPHDWSLTRPPEAWEAPGCSVVLDAAMLCRDVCVWGGGAGCSRRPDSRQLTGGVPAWTRQRCRHPPWRHRQSNWTSPPQVPRTFVAFVAVVVVVIIVAIVLMVVAVACVLGL